jgi:hypothetical protein
MGQVVERAVHPGIAGRCLPEVMPLRRDRPVILLLALAARRALD